jgi:hypothetical protein
MFQIQLLKPTIILQLQTSIILLHQALSLRLNQIHIGIIKTLDIVMADPLCPFRYIHSLLQTPVMAIKGIMEIAFPRHQLVILQGSRHSRLTNPLLVPLPRTIQPRRAHMGILLFHRMDQKILNLM